MTPVPSSQRMIEGTLDSLHQGLGASPGWETAVWGSFRRSLENKASAEHLGVPTTHPSALTGGTVA